MKEDDWKKLIDKKWKVFWKRYKEDFPIANYMENKIIIRLEKMFEKISPFYGESRSGSFGINENGKVTAFDPIFLLFGAIGETILEELEKKYELGIKKTTKKLDKLLDAINEANKNQEGEIKKIHRYLKYAIPELENLIECPHCKEYNPPDVSYCICCNKEILMEKNNGKKDK